MYVIFFIETPCNSSSFDEIHIALSFCHSCWYDCDTIFYHSCYTSCCYLLFSSAFFPFYISVREIHQILNFYYNAMQFYQYFVIFACFQWQKMEFLTASYCINHLFTFTFLYLWVQIKSMTEMAHQRQDLFKTGRLSLLLQIALKWAKT